MDLPVFDLAVLAKKSGLIGIVDLFQLQAFRMDEFVKLFQEGTECFLHQKRTFPPQPGAGECHGFA